MADIEFRLNSVIRSMADTIRYGAGASALSARGIDNAELKGIAMLPESRRELDRRLQAEWNAQNGYIAERIYGEVIIGSGIHAAIYCANRVRNGFPKPLVIERSTRPGGIFALSKGPAFYLNSRNRPGLLGLPGMNQALNYLPGADIQPADISMAEYQTNEDLAFVIRVTLAKYANVETKATVKNVRTQENPIEIELESGRVLRARRVLDATGLGDVQGVRDSSSTRILPATAFLASLDSPFPTRDMGRLAVIGDGDTARVTMEALLGIGPDNPGSMMTASLDFIPRIDWYAPTLDGRCKDVRNNTRTRYARLLAYVRKNDRVRIIPRRGETQDIGNAALVDIQTYDRVIQATGFRRNEIAEVDFGYRTFVPPGTDSRIAIAQKNEYGELYKIGPAANLEYTSAEFSEEYARRRENRVAIFRYAPRTAALAKNLPAPFKGLGDD